MQKNSENFENIVFVEKPSYISWDAIQDCQRYAHRTNDSYGLHMACQDMSGEELSQSVSAKGGKCFVALHNKCILGTLSILTKKISRGFFHLKVGYCCYIAIDPAYRGYGIYKNLTIMRDKYMKEQKLSLLYLDTAKINVKACKVYEHDGFIKVLIKRFPQCNYDSVFFAKAYNWRWQLILWMFSGITYHFSSLYYKI